MKLGVGLIAEVGIDPKGFLYVVPAKATFPFIYRAAMQVGWDEERQRLFSPTPREMSYAQWFGHIRSAVADEYGITLEVHPDTIWTDIPRALRSEIEGR